ncbi:MAG: hypothetical protein M0P59_03530 [Gallionella sp.]|jgi:hypothetical protein|nr:hypothetical protein [Gallionella sp.]MCK9353210.1 hypothetical protein [Gallionella sp.]
MAEPTNSLIAMPDAESTGDQPKILENLALAQQIFNQNLQQQIALNQQQALNVIQLAVVAKCAAIIEKIDVPGDQAGVAQLVEAIKEIMQCVSNLQEPMKGTT